MAATIKRIRRANRPEYPWALWTDGKARRAAKGKDFRCSGEGFRQTLASHAARNGLRVSVSVKEKHVEFQFSTPAPT